jgi:TOBE domain-containing protein
MAEITVDLGGQIVVAAITRESAENLELSEGDEVTVLIKATEVMRTPRRLRPSSSGHTGRRSRIRGARSDATLSAVRTRIRQRRVLVELGAAAA